ncbi:MAG: chemotaxis protein CheD [Proteobacteria bacterium]|nr:chemotaxis protein CheD [Pseudomonadota bacterium]MBU1688773.1 chemotaxis protein CheD [Pseudomonadota bacterium]
MTVEDCIPLVYLKPGEIFFDKKSACVSTVLGSCVAVTMVEHHTGFASICHAQLPRCKDHTKCLTGCSEKYKYMDCSIEAMLAAFSKHGINPAQLEIKIFGGANGVGSSPALETAGKIGRMNIEVALSTLAARGLSPHNSDIDGTSGRKIYFMTPTGEVWAKRFKGKNLCNENVSNIPLERLTFHGMKICSPVIKERFRFLK